MNQDKNHLLKLENQVCFPLYATSRLIIQLYQPLLEKIGLTYPQYLVMMILWEKDDIPIKFISKKLLLNTNTLTPLLQRMEKNGLIIREKCLVDERKVKIKLSAEGKKLQSKAIEVPQHLQESLQDSSVSIEELHQLKETLTKLIKYIDKK
ncbi:MarR family transcriptional regulator [Flavobacteriaceae bacterium Ap0902]|nr:MarR family transcriptional regulator [Flavobacteriaceae bacterium Ap0902]